jgi:hypothetical protein
MRMLPRRTVRLRLTALYGMLFLLCGAVLLAITNGFGSTASVTRAVPAGSGAVPAGSAGQLGDQATASVHAAISHEFLIGSAIALGIMTVASAGLGWVVAGRVLRPLQAMTATTRRISADSLDERLAVTGPGDELKDLADTIDGLLGRLEGAFAAQRRFVANASHELRTPLATMRASVDVAVAKPEPVPAQTIALAGRLRTELDSVDRLLDGLLVLARAQHGALPGQATLSLDAIVSAALAARASSITAKRLTVEHDSSPDGAWVQASQPLLSRLVDNVIDNAITHNHDGGWVRAATGADGENARLVVETGGDVIDQQQVAQLGQPFRRLGADRTGTGGGAGLGLSIVAAIAAAHGGTLELRARSAGGLRVAIALPTARPAGAGAVA